MNYLLTEDRRTVIAEIPADLRSRMDYTSEATRLAYFEQSRLTVAGSRAEFRFNLQVAAGETAGR